VSATLSAQILYMSFMAWNVLVLLLMIGIACAALNWAISKFADVYTLVRSIQEAYRQGRDPWRPFWRRKAKEMREDTK
jgi:hypothetical protein